jgi:cellulose synthase/poly-beta-1,6-N-acetylglucosamine synthase-like glycosyltransferase
LKDADAIVRTKPPPHLRQFFSQRIRWASKAKGYRTPWSIVVPLVVSFFNLMLAAVFVGGFYESWLFAIFLLYILLKFLVDLPLLFDFMTFSNKRKLRFFVFPLQIIYPFYIVLTAFISLFFRYQWKGRSGLR